MRKLSFIVPLYNSSKWMNKCIGSLLDQDVPQDEYEIILVDDGSPDESGRIADEFARKHQNVRVIHQSNKGPSGARNTGMAAADSKYIWLVDPDDYIEPNCLSRLLSIMESGNLDILRFGYRLVDEEYKEVKKHPSELKNDYSPNIFNGDDFLNERMGTACYIWTFIFKLSVIRDNGILCYEGDYFDDTPWTPRVIRAAGRIDSIPDICYNYLQRDNSLVRSNANIDKKIEGQRFLIKELSRQKAEASPTAKKWYDRMLAQCALSLISAVALQRKEDVDETLSFLKQYNMRPVCLKKTFPKFARKAALFNISPKAYIRLLQFKNR